MRMWSPRMKMQRNWWLDWCSWFIPIVWLKDKDGRSVDQNIWCFSLWSVNCSLKGCWFQQDSARQRYTRDVHRSLSKKSWPENDQLSDSISVRTHRIWNHGISDSAAVLRLGPPRKSCLMSGISKMWCTTTLSHCHLAKFGFLAGPKMVAISNSGMTIICCDSNISSHLSTDLPDTDLAVSNCVTHDGTSYAVLKRVEAEFWCGTSRCDTGTQCWVHRVNVKAAHFGARVLKRETTRGGPMPNRTGIWLFQGVNVDEIGWNFCKRTLTPWPTISTGIHSPSPPAPWASTQKPHV